jgi:hypothetical protein
MTWRMLGSVVGALRWAFICVLNMEHISVSALSSKISKCLRKVSGPQISSANPQICGLNFF